MSTDQKAPATLRELIAMATPGPYFVSHDDKQMDYDGYYAHVASGLAVVDTGRSGDWPIARFMEWPAARLTERLTPGVMLAAIEAMEMAINTVECDSLDKDGNQLPWYRATKKALALLNGGAP